MFVSRNAPLWALAVVLAACGGSQSGNGTDPNDPSNNNNNNNNGANAAPVFTQLAPLDVDEGATKSLTLAASDTNGDPLTFAMEGAPPFVKLEGATVTIAPTFTDAGTFSIKFTVSDGKGGTDGGTFALTVKDVNRAPKLAALTAVTMNEGETKTVALDATDADGDVLTFDLAAGAPTWASLTGKSLALTPGFDDAGTATLTVNVADAKGGKDTATLAVTVTNVNRAPAFGAVNPVSVAEGATQQVQLTATDADNDTITYALASGAPSWATVSADKVVLAPGYTDAGTHNLALEATDGKGGKGTATLVVTVTDTNRPPSIGLLSPVTMDEGATKTVKFTGTDPDGDALTYTLGLGAPAWASISGDTLTLTPGFTDSGTTNVTLKVEDGKGGSDSGFIAVTVNDVNRGPVFGAVPATATVNEGETQTVTLSATDPDGGAVTFSIGGTVKPAWATLSGTTLTLAPGFSDAGSFAIVIEASDGTGGVSTHTITVTVADVNRAPTLSTVANVSMAELETKTVTLSATDPDGDTLTYTLGTGAPSWATLSGSTLTLAPQTGNSGTVTLSVSVSDGKLSDSKSFTVTVAVTNTAPTLTAPAQVDAAGNPVALGASGPTPPRLKATVADAQGDQVKLEAEVIPVASTFSGTPTHSGTLAPAGTLTLSLGSLAVGDYKWQVRAADGAGFAGSWTVFSGGAKAFTITPQSLNGSIVVAAGATATRFQNVNIALTLTGGATGASMRFSNDGTNFSPSETYGATKVNWGLDVASGDGQKTVTAEVTDTLGNKGVFTDTIIYDATAPSGNFSINAGAQYASSTTVELTVSVADATSGMQKFEFSNDDVTYSAVTLTAGKASWTLDAAGGAVKTVYGRFTDNAGNVLSRTQTITLDAANPTVSVSINAGALYTKTTGVTLTITANDAASGIATVCYSNDGTTFTGCGAAVASKAWTLTSGDGAKTVTVKATDNAGNSATATATITLDATAPTASFVIAGGTGYTNQNPTPLTITASDATSGLDQMQFSNDNGVSFSTLEPYAATKSWGLLTGDGTKSVILRVTDKAGNSFTTGAVSVVLDTGLPSGTLLVKGSESTNSYTNTTAVTLNITSSDGSGSGFGTMEFSNDGTTFSAPIAVATTASHTLASGDGQKTVTMRLKDRAGNAKLVTDTIILDATPPTVTLSVNNGAAATNTTSVTLNYGISDAGGIARQEASNDGTVWTTVTAASPAAWTLASTDGTKTVYFRATDVAGNTTTVTDTIVLDTGVPTLTSASINNTAAYTNALAVSITNVAADNTGGSGLASICVSETVNPPTTCQAYSPSAAFTLTGTDGTKTVYVRVRDAAGNYSNVITDTIVYDATPPALPSITINTSANFTTTLNVSVGSAATDTGGSGVAKIQLSNDNFVTMTELAYAASVSWALPAGDGLKTVYAKVKDNAGNFSTPVVSDTITVDTTPPTGTVAINSGAQYTQSQTGNALAITYNDATSGVSKMCVKNGTATPPAAPTAADVCFVAAATTVGTYDLGAGDGLKYVYVWFLDAAGNVSTGSISDTIFLDTVNPPAPTGVGSLSGNRTVVVSWAAATDPGGTAGSGIAGYEVGVSTTTGAGYVFQSLVTTTSTTLTLPNEQLAYIVVRAKDNAGRYSVNSTEISDMPSYPFQFQSRTPNANTIRGISKSGTADALLVGGGGTVYTLNGATLTRRDPFVDEDLYGVVHDDGGFDTVVGAKGTVATTTNVGRTWYAGTSDSTGTFTSVASAGSVNFDRKLVAVGVGGLISVGTRPSTNRSYTFVKVATSPTTYTLNGVAACATGSTCEGTVVAVGNSGVIVRSTDRGVTWSTVGSPTAGNLWTIENVAGTSTMLAGGANGLYRSTDAGATWSPAISGFPGGIYGISAQSATNIWVTAAGSPPIYRWDGTAAPVANNTLPTSARVGTLYAINADSALNVTVAGTAGEVAVTTNTGTSWTDLSVGPVFTIEDIDSVAGYSSYAWAVGGNGRILYTSNAGATWTEQTSSTTSFLHGIGAATTSLAFAVGNSGRIVKGSNPGTGFAWTTDTSGTTESLYGVACGTVSTTSNCYAVGTNNTILYWTAAAGWTVKMTGGNTNFYRAIDMVVSGTTPRGIAVGTGGSVATMNAATVTVPTSSGIPTTVSLNGVALRSDGVAMAVADSGRIWKSTNYGSTWTQIAGTGTTNPTTAQTLWDIGVISANVTGFTNPSMWYASGAAGTMLRSVDDGATWTVLQTNFSGDIYGVEQPSTNPDRVWGTGSNGAILFSTSRGL